MGITSPSLQIHASANLRLIYLPYRRFLKTI